jgi:hypothetical protein
MEGSILPGQDFSQVGLDTVVLIDLRDGLFLVARMQNELAATSSTIACL